jgi:hypothetical protein
MTGTHPQNRRLGYARVSTYGQTLDAQLEQLRGAGCTKIYREKVTGAHSDRRELLKMLAALAPGDVVTVTRIYRLARSTFSILSARGRPRAGAAPKPKGSGWADPPHSQSGAAEGGHHTPRGRCDAARTRPELRRRHIHHSPRDASRMSFYFGQT